MIRPIKKNKTINVGPVSFLSVALITLVTLNVACTSFIDDVINDYVRKAAKVDPLPGVYEVWGLLTNQEKLVESSGGAVYVPHLVLDVDKVVKVEAKVRGTTATGDKKFLKLTWDQIEESWFGIYGIKEPLKSFFNKKLHIRGIIYNQCGRGWYLSREDDETHCGSVLNPTDPTHIELKNWTGH